jgi:hypothetical protein
MRRNSAAKMDSLVNLGRKKYPPKDKEEEEEDEGE